MHRKSRRKVKSTDNGYWGKTIVMGSLERDGEVRAAVSPSRRKHHIQPHIVANVEPGTKMYTDEHHGYDDLPEGYAREFVDHISTYVKGRVHTNGLENYWSLLKRGLKGTYVSVDPAHLQSYVDEQAFRYNNRKEMDDAERFSAVLCQLAGKRLTYADLTGREMEGVR